MSFSDPAHIRAHPLPGHLIQRAAPPRRRTPAATGLRPSARRPGRSRQSDLRPARSASPSHRGSLAGHGLCRPVRAAGLSARPRLHHGFLRLPVRRLRSGADLPAASPPHARALPGRRRRCRGPHRPEQRLGRGSVPSHDGSGKKRSSGRFLKALVARHRRDPRRLGRALAGTGHRPRHAGHAPVHLRFDQPAQGRHGQSREPHGQHPRHPSGFRHSGRGQQRVLAAHVP